MSKEYFIRFSDVDKMYQTNRYIYIETKWLDLNISKAIAVSKISIDRRIAGNFENIDLNIYKNYNPASYLAKTFREDGIAVNTRGLIANTIKLVFKIEIPEFLADSTEISGKLYSNPISNISIKYKEEK